MTSNTWIALLAACAGIVPAGGASAQRDVAWYLSLSASPTDCQQNYSAPFVGEKTLYLVPCEEFDSMERLEFGLSGSLEIVSVTPAPGNVIQGTPSTMIVASKTAPQGCLVMFPWILEIVVRDETGLGGDVCFVPSEENQRICKDRCDWSSEWSQFPYGGPVGFASAGVVCWAPETDCGPTSVEAETWGKTKALYKD